MEMRWVIQTSRNYEYGYTMMLWRLFLNLWHCLRSVEYRWSAEMGNIGSFGQLLGQSLPITKSCESTIPFTIKWDIMKQIVSRCRITCILGHKSGFPCPICLVPRLEQGNLDGIWPERTVNSSEMLVLRAKRSKYLKDQDEILSEQSLRICPVSCS